MKPTTSFLGHIAGTRGSTGPTRQRHTEQGRGLIGKKLTNGEVTSGSVTTNAFPNSTRTYRYLRLARRITRAVTTQKSTHQKNTNYKIFLKNPMC